MTATWELFYTRRSRSGRTGSQDPGLHSFTSSSERSFNNRRHHYHNHRHDLDGCDPVRRPSQVRHLSHRPSQSERPSGRLDQGSSPFVSSNTINTVISRSTSGPSVNGNERLPGAVLLARARLLERLRGVSLSENRSSSASSGVNRRENIIGDEFRLTDVDRGAETSGGWFTGGSPFADLPPQTERLHLLQEPKSKPPGLTQEAMNCLHSEVFSSFGKIVEGEVLEASVDCSICLESFIDGDELIHLPCNHRFHSGCLDPWVRSCGDCPYCRRDIVVNSHRDMKRT